MDDTAKAKRAARSLIDLLLLLGIVLVGAALVGTALESAEVDSRRRLVEREARVLFEAFERFYQRNGAYPNAYEPPSLNFDSLDPLRRRGYYDGRITGELVGRRIDAYDSPDDGGVNQEFWLEMTLSADPSVRFVVARSDDAPSGGGRWLEGVFVTRGDEVKPL